MELRVASVSLADTLEGLMTLIRPLAETRKIRLILDVASKLPLIETDPGKLQQVAFNFLANAVKFTPSGGTVTMRAELWPRPKTPAPAKPGGSVTTTRPASQVCISISDTGPGIPPDDQERIFEKFTQLDPSVTKVHGGTGLGLTIAKELTEMLGGYIEVDSLPGQGATFSVILPLVAPVYADDEPRVDAPAIPT